MIVPILIGVPEAVLLLLVELAAVEELVDEELQAATVAVNANKAATQVTDLNLITCCRPLPS
jgi:hypothetical protein